MRGKKRIMEMGRGGNKEKLTEQWGGSQEINRKQWWPDDRQSQERGRKATTERNCDGSDRVRLLEEREHAERRSCLAQQYVYPILKKWTTGTVKSSLSPSHLFLSHAWLAALFSQVQRCVTSTKMSLEQGETNEPGIPWEGWIMGIGRSCLWGLWVDLV